MPRPPAKAQGIADALAARIVDGVLPPGTWLPSERDIAEEFAADRSTVRRAVRMLAGRGLVVLTPGTGAQVRPTEPVRRNAADVTRQVGHWRGFHVSALSAGREPYTQTTVGEVEVDAQVARWLAVPVGTRVLKRARLQGIVDEAPIQTATTWVIPEIVRRLPILREVDTGPGGIYSRLEEIGHPLAFEETVTCRLPNADEQRILCVEPGQPVLTLWRRGYGRDDRIVEVTHRIVVGHRHELVYRYGS